MDFQGWTCKCVTYHEGTYKTTRNSDNIIERSMHRVPDTLTGAYALKLPRVRAYRRKENASAMFCLVGSRLVCHAEDVGVNYDVCRECEGSRVSSEIGGGMPKSDLSPCDVIGNRLSF